MNVMSVCAVCVVLAAACAVFRQWNKEYSVFIAILCGCGVLYVSAVSLMPVIDELNSAVSSEAVGKYVTVMLKGLGICYVAGFASSICNDCGEKSIGDKVELAAKVAIAVLYSPILIELLKTAVDMIKE